jgi:hypothetical protein
VGSFASGSDLARQLASLNIGKYEPNSSEEGYTKVYVSCSTPPEGIDPWTPYINYLPLISHCQNGKLVLDDGQEVGVDTIIFATGYNFSLPFCKITDYPWSDPKYQVLDEVIQEEEREGGREGEVGGMKGLSMDKLDEVMLFLQADEGRSIAFPALREFPCSHNTLNVPSLSNLPYHPGHRRVMLMSEYQIVPFPLVETQTRLTALIWSGALTLPHDLKLPPNPSNPYHSSPPSTSTPEVEKQKKEEGAEKKSAPRKTIQLRKKLVFGASYEFIYQEYLISLLQDVDDPGWVRLWWGNQDMKKRWRGDTMLRKRTLGY